MVYIYVEEDVETDSIMAERPWWARWLKNQLTLGGIFGDVTRGGFTVYEGELDPEGRLVRLDELVCGRLIRSKANWFYSFPETRPYWRRGREQLPEPLFLRSELERHGGKDE